MDGRSTTMGCSWGWGSRDGDGRVCVILEVGVGVRVGTDPEAIPRSVASLYLRIFAEEILDVK